MRDPDCLEIGSATRSSDYDRALLGATHAFAAHRVYEYEQQAL